MGQAQAASKHDMKPRSISFKGVVQILNACLPLVAGRCGKYAAPSSPGPVPAKTAMALFHIGDCSQFVFRLQNMASLSFEQSGQPVNVSLTGSAVTIGRDPSLDVVLRDEAVSRRHARIFRVNGVWQLQDTGSTGGTFLNRTKISPDQPVPLSHGDSVRIGPFKIRFANEDELADARREKHFPGFEIEDDNHSSITGSVQTSGYGLVSVRPQDKLNGILKINEALAGNVDLHAICPRVLETLFDIFPQADRGAILLLNGASNDLQPVANRHRRPEDSSIVRISRTILRNVLNDNSAILSTNTPLDPRMADSESVFAQMIHSTLCVPMLGVDGKPFGIISLDSQNPRRQFSADDLQLLVAVASQASHAFENARLLTAYMEKLKQDHEIRISAQVQKALIPETMPEPPGYRMYGSYDAAKTVGGDYYDSFVMPNGKVCVSFGDVSGKGFPAALIMARLSGIVRNTMNFTDDVGLAVGQINTLMCSSMASDRFVTYILGVLDPFLHTFTFANAGHMPPEVRRLDGSLCNPGTDTSGPPIGFDASVQYETMTVPISPGDIFVLRTDGIDEAMTSQSEQFGEARFREAIRTSIPDPESICRSLLTAVQAFAGSEPQMDDITIMAFGRVE
jgi:sigma-B regulation protein RsbU (phosphoserine phosphatase)